MRLLAVLLALASSGCQAIAADPEFTYVECLPRADGTYEEKFDRALPPETRCWQTEGVMKSERIREEDGDLAIYPDENVGSEWGSQSAAFFFREVTGDFLAVARAEAVSGHPHGDHCLDAEEAAGLAVRQREPWAWATLLVQPDLEGAALKDSTFCGDDPPTPPFAKITSDSSGFGGPETQPPLEGRGVDAEADIGVCRKDDELFFYVQLAPTRAEAEKLPNIEPHFTQLSIGYGPVDVGLTATAVVGEPDPQGAGGAPSEPDTLPQGHFNWLYLRDFGETPMEEGCPKALEAFAYPEDE